MGEESSFLAGAMFKWTTEEDLTHIKGRVYLIIEADSSDLAREQRDALVDHPELFIELLETMRPWHREMVQFDYDLLNKHMTLKDIFTTGKDQ